MQECGIVPLLILEGFPCLADGRVVDVECLSCALTGGLIEPTGGVIYEEKYFHAHQDVAYPIQG